MIPVSPEQLQALAAMAPKPPTKPTPSGEYRGAGQPFDLDRWIPDHGLNVATEKPWNGGRRMILSVCPFNPDHSDGSAVITQSAEGQIGFKCHHNSCEDKHWRDVRELLEPGAYDRPGGSFSGNGIRPNGEPGETLPIIQGNDRQVRDVSADCIAALVAGNNPDTMTEGTKSAHGEKAVL